MWSVPVNFLHLAALAAQNEAYSLDPAILSANYDRIAIRYEEYSGARETIAELRRKAESAPLPPKPVDLLGSRCEGG